MGVVGRMCTQWISNLFWTPQIEAPDEAPNEAPNEGLNKGLISWSERFRARACVKSKRYTCPLVFGGTI